MHDDMHPLSPLAHCEGEGHMMLHIMSLQQHSVFSVVQIVLNPRVAQDGMTAMSIFFCHSNLHCVHEICASWPSRISNLYPFISGDDNMAAK